MSCFPFMADIRGKVCLLVGGGNVALRKARALLPFGARIAVCAESIAQELSALCEREYNAYSPSLLEGVGFVIAATDDAALNARVAADCRAARIPVNCVDDAKNCDFFFPALVVRGGVSVGISTGGLSPALARVVREYIESVLPQNLAEIAENAAKMRKNMPSSEYIAAVREQFYTAAERERSRKEDPCKS